MTTPNLDPVARELIPSDFPEDTLGVVRDLLAVAAAAVTAPYPWDSCGEGIARLIAVVDAALAHEIDNRRPWANPDRAVEEGIADATE